MIKFVHEGHFDSTKKFLKRMQENRFDAMIEQIAKAGVSALSSATPVDTGKTAASWGYEIEKSSNKIVVNFTNSNVNHGVNIAVILQYGHGTKNGGFVQGRDYINPALQPIFDKLEEDMWKVVVSK